MPICGSRFTQFSMAVSQPGRTIVSLLRKQIYFPRASRAPRLLPLANPKFSPGLITRTGGGSCDKYSAVPSVEPLSTTITSKFTGSFTVKSEVMHGRV